MNEEKLIENLEEKYILVKKGKWWSFLGGAFAFLFVAGIISYQAGLSALEGHAAKKATNSILRLEEKAKFSVKEAKEIISTLRDPDYIAGWTLVFENDAEGNVVSGKLSNLVEAVRKGADVKIYMRRIKARQDLTAPCDWTFIDTSTSKDVVLCMNTSHISMQKTADEKFRFQKDAYHWFGLVSTEGEIDESRWSVGEHKDRGHSQGRIAVKWFVRFL